MDGQGADATLVSAGKVERGKALDQQVTLEHRQPRGQSKQTVHNIVANGGKCTFKGASTYTRALRAPMPNCPTRTWGWVNTQPSTPSPNWKFTLTMSVAPGATVGTISQDALFYLTSRGIDRTDAEGLLSQGFLRQCIDGRWRISIGDLTGKAGEAA